MTSSTDLVTDVRPANQNPFEHLETVSLATLNTQAALQTRTDRKYLIAAPDLAGLFPRLPAGVRVLEIDGRLHASYTSTYFDTPTFDSYLGAARSRPNRFKVRVRTYLDSDVHYLEVKTRNRTGSTSKVRCSVEAENHEGLGHSDRTFVVETLADKSVGRFKDNIAPVVAALDPTLSTQYQRTTLLIEPQTTGLAATPTPSRATIDTSLAFTAPGRSPLNHPGLAIIETKTPGPPSLIDRLLWRAGQRPVKVSKYAVGLALFHPGLPATKWNRVLRREFGWKPQHEA